MVKSFEFSHHSSWNNDNDSSVYRFSNLPKDIVKRYKKMSVATIEHHFSSVIPLGVFNEIHEAMSFFMQNELYIIKKVESDEWNNQKATCQLRGYSLVGMKDNEGFLIREEG